MHTVSLSPANIESEGGSSPAAASAYVWLIALAAALGGLLFGYDWVVIGGARQFFEVYFHLGSAAAVGWANSCALLGCLGGSLVAGPLAERAGRKPVLILSALLFLVSSVFTGEAQTFFLFIVWRISGGVAIGLCSNISPVYIAEISPAAHRGRLVSLNQFAVVAGILLAQIVNWRIAEPIAGNASPALTSWNVQHGWRWMFIAVAVPAAVFLLALIAIPESPRWLLAQGSLPRARAVLARITGSAAVAQEQCAAILADLAFHATDRPAWRSLLAPGVRPVLAIAIGLAVLQQWCGINILFNYAEEIFRAAGLGAGQIFLDIVVTGAINLAATVLAMLIVDRAGRRPLMLAGCIGIAAAHLLAALAYKQGWHGTPVLVLTLCAIACYAATLAPLTWVLIAELFPNNLRSLGVSAAVSCLWIASFVLTDTFPFLERAAGNAGAFLVYGSVCVAGALFVYRVLPETRGRTLEQIGEAAQVREP